MNQIPWLNLPRLNVYMTFLNLSHSISILLNSLAIFVLGFVFLVGIISLLIIFLLLIILLLLSSEESLVGCDDADEVSIESKKDGGFKKDLEEVVLLLEFLVLFF